MSHQLNSKNQLVRNDLPCSTSCCRGVAKALWDYSSQRQEERWEDGDLRGYDPFAPKHHYDASLLSYRLLGVGLIACALIIMWYAR